MILVLSLSSVSWFLSSSVSSWWWATGQRFDSFCWPANSLWCCHAYPLQHWWVVTDQIAVVLDCALEIHVLVCLLSLFSPFPPPHWLCHSFLSNLVVLCTEVWLGRPSVHTCSHYPLVLCFVFAWCLMEVFFRGDSAVFCSCCLSPWPITWREADLNLGQGISLYLVIFVAKCPSGLCLVSRTFLQACVPRISGATSTCSTPQMSCLVESTLTRYAWSLPCYSFCGRVSGGAWCSVSFVHLSDRWWSTRSFASQMNVILCLWAGLWEWG